MTSTPPRGHKPARRRAAVEVLLVLFRAVLAAREREHQRIAALKLAQRADGAGAVGQRVIGEGAAGDDVGKTMEMIASPLPPRVRRGRCSCRFAPTAWLYQDAPVCLPVGVPVGAHAHTSGSPGSLKRHAILGRPADRPHDCREMVPCPGLRTGGRTQPGRSTKVVMPKPKSTGTEW